MICCHIYPRLKSKRYFLFVGIVLTPVCYYLFHDVHEVTKRCMKPNRMKVQNNSYSLYKYKRESRVDL